MRNHAPLLSILPIALLACAQPGDELALNAAANGSAESLRMARHSLFAAQEEFNESLAAHGAVQGVEGALRFDASYNHPGEPLITGRSAILDFLESFYAGDASATVQYHALAGDVSIDRTLGFTFGWFEETRDGTVGYGRYIFAWRRTPFRWKIHGFNRAEATSPADPPPDDARILDLSPGRAHWAVSAANAAEVAAADYAFAELSIDEGYSVAFATYPDDAATAIGTNGLYYNAETVAAVYSGWTPAETLRWAPIRAESTASGDLGWSVGYSTYIYAPPDVEPYRGLGKYMTIWRRSESGDWGFLVDGGSDGR